MNLERPRCAGVPVLLLTLLLAPSASYAQNRGDDPETGRQLFQYGRGYYERRQWTQALDAFHGSLDALPSPNTRLYVGRCLRELGRPAEAWLELERTADEADARRAQDPRYVRTAETARQESGALADRVAFLVVDLQQQVAGVTVQVNGRALPSERWGRLYAIDPGAITVDAFADGYTPFRATSSVTAGQQARVDVRLQPVGAAGMTAPTTRSVTVLAANDPGALPVPVAPVAAPQRSPWRAVGLVSMGVGGALGVAGLLTGMSAAGARADLDAACPQGCGPTPTADVLATVDRGRQMQLLTNIAWVAGGALIVGGAVAFFASGGSAQELYAPTFARRTPRPARWAPFVDPARSAAGIVGTF